MMMLGPVTSFRANEDGSVTVELPKDFFDGQDYFLADGRSEFQAGLETVTEKLRERRQVGPRWLR